MNEGKSIQELVDDALRESFIKVEEVDLGTKEREEAHKERMDLLQAAINVQKEIDDADNARMKLEDEKKSRFKERLIKIGEVIVNGAVKLGGIIGTTVLSLKLYDFAAGKDGFLTKDQTSGIGLLQGIINRT